jgi:glycosyltransferase involved in cell wall biosynthesis
MRVLYVCNDHAYFEAHRRWLADAAVARGDEVFVACGAVLPGSEGTAREVIPLKVVRHSFAVSDLYMALAVRRLAKQLKADIVHLITLKAILFGSLGLIASRQPRRVVATFPGLGRLFDMEERSLGRRLQRWLVSRGLTLSLGARRVSAIFETAADRALMVEQGIIDPRRAHHIAGAGVDPLAYPRAPLPGGRLKVLFAGRLLRSKGVMQVVDAASILADAGVDAEMLIAGAGQGNDPDALSGTEVAKLYGAPHVRYLGSMPSEQMARLLAEVHVVVLPTVYQEGVPRILIEAAAVGRPAIVSDNPGCVAFVKDGESGCVLEAPTAEAIAECVARLAIDRTRLERLADGAWTTFSQGGFAMANVRDKTLRLYRH